MDASRDGCKQGWMQAGMDASRDIHVHTSRNIVYTYMYTQDEVIPAIIVLLAREIGFL